jgi:cobyrinic acid a,c-diamide synthase
MGTGSRGSRRAALLVAATHSGAGKTTVTGIVLRALRRRGRSVQPFKLGPDFIDAAYHAEAAGRPAVNLDLWMMGAEEVRRSFEQHSRDADVAVIESMGALYDGTGGTEEGSAAQLAKLLDVPVVVVLDVWGMTRTTAALLQGLRAFDPDVRIAGCVLNRVGSAAHAELIVSSLPPELRGLVVGTVERRAELAVAERHLGILTVEENPTTPAARARAYAQAAEAIDVDRLLTIAGADAATTTRRGRTRQPESSAPPRAVATLAVARDEAFCFYYEENLTQLREAGFALIPFQPTRDQRLPAGADAVYLGGGYPESFAAALAANTSLIAELRQRAADGMPVYAECGGLMYLSRSLVGYDGSRHELAGLLPLDIAMDASHLSIRYAEVHTRHASILGAAGTVARGQEFHQSRVERAEIEPSLFDVTDSDGLTHRAGYRLGNVVASYVHLHFSSNRALARSLARAAVMWSQRP